MLNENNHSNSTMSEVVSTQSGTHLATDGNDGHALTANNNGVSNTTSNGQDNADTVVDAVETKSNEQDVLAPAIVVTKAEPGVIVSVDSEKGQGQENEKSKPLRLAEVDEDPTALAPGDCNNRPSSKPSSRQSSPLRHKSPTPGVATRLSSPAPSQKSPSKMGEKPPVQTEIKADEEEAEAEEEEDEEIGEEDEDGSDQDEEGSSKTPNRASSTRNRGRGRGRGRVRGASLRGRTSRANSREALTVTVGLEDQDDHPEEEDEEENSTSAGHISPTSDDEPLSGKKRSASKEEVEKSEIGPNLRRSARSRREPTAEPSYQGRLRRNNTSSSLNLMDVSVKSEHLEGSEDLHEAEVTRADSSIADHGDDETTPQNSAKRKRGRNNQMTKDELPDEPAPVQEDVGKKLRRSTTAQSASSSSGLKRCEACGVEATSLNALRYGSGRFCSKTCVGLFANKHRLRVRNKMAAEANEAANENSMDGVDESISSRNANRKRISGPAGANNATKRGRSNGGSQSTVADEHSNDSNGSSDGSGPSSASSHFDWAEYLKETHSKAVPKEVFRNPFPTFNPSTFFQVNQRLEGIDPRHPSLFCVFSVAQVVGFRIRLHFDGFSSAYDFWTNADSPYIFPCGWTEKSGRKLQMPKGWKRSKFTWPAYLKATNSTAAPDELFTSLKLPPSHPGLKRGQKLEAVDKANTLLTCVASLADFYGDRLLIHFDGWGDMYDFWTSASSPYLHAVGWCQDMGRALSPPQDYPDIENFTWEDYMAETGSESIPANVFKSRPPGHFVVGEKMEAVDRRNPSLLRVATVVETADFRVKIRYDGWPENFDIYVDDDCADIHPCGWSTHVDHPLEAPPSVQHAQNCPGASSLHNIGATSTCPTYGCRGVGHVKGPKFGNHSSACGCPYAQSNMERRNNERLAGTDSLVENATILTMAERPNYDGTKNGSSKNTHHHNNGSKNGSRSNMTRRPSNHGPGDGKESSGHQRHRGPRGPSEVADSVRRFIFNAPLKNGSVNGQNGPAFPMSTSLVMDRLLEAINPDLALINKMQRTNVAKLTNSPMKNGHSDGSNNKKDEPAKTKIVETPAQVDSNELIDAQALADGITPRLVATWNVQKVVEFVRSLPGCQQNSQAFADEQIDGTALLLLNQADMLKIMNMKLGPVLKIFNVIQAIKRAT